MAVQQAVQTVWRLDSAASVNVERRLPWKGFYLLVSVPPGWAAAGSLCLAALTEDRSSLRDGFHKSRSPHQLVVEAREIGVLFPPVNFGKAEGKIA